MYFHIYSVNKLSICNGMSSQSSFWQLLFGGKICSIFQEVCWQYQTNGKHPMWCDIVV